jgi:hypothetical protein
VTFGGGNQVSGSTAQAEDQEVVARVAETEDQAFSVFLIDSRFYE